MENDEVNNKTIYYTSSKKKDWLQMDNLLSTEGKYGEKNYGRKQTIELLFTITTRMRKVYVSTVYCICREHIHILRDRRSGTTACPAVLGDGAK
jgi:hypothetical protein